MKKQFTHSTTASVMLRLRQWPALCALVCLLMTLPAYSADEYASSNEDPLSEQALKKRHDVALGEVVYSLYVDDALTTLSKMAMVEQKAENSVVQNNPAGTHADMLSLLKGGVALGFGMPHLAQQKLSSQAQSLQDGQRPLAWYWLARLNFSQALGSNGSSNGLQAGLDAYNAFVSSLEASDSELDELLTPAQWYELNYEAAQASMALTKGAMSTDNTANAAYPGIERFIAVLPESHIARQYLGYNEAVSAFERGDYALADQRFKQLAYSLSRELEREISASGWFSWLNWWQDKRDESVTKHETHALLNEVLLARGQTLLMLGEQEQAIGVFDAIDTDIYANDVRAQHTDIAQNTVPERGSAQSLIRDEALLHYGWGLAQSGDWPLAMGVWSFLSEQDNNLYTLQATHALAYGYAQQGGEVQAYATLQLLLAKLTVVIDELELLSRQIEQERYWQSVALGVNTLQIDQAETMRTSNQAPRHQVNGVSTHGASVTTPWQSLWPASHKDLLMDLITDTATNAGNQGQDQLENLTSLYHIQRQLLAQRNLTTTFDVLLDEREQTHKARVANHQSQQSEEQLKQAQAVFTSLEQRIALAEQHTNLPVGESTNDMWLAGLATFANAEQLAWLNRLSNAEQRLARVSKERTVRPAYGERLARIKGVLAWQLSEQYPKARWQHKKALDEVAERLYDAKRAQLNFSTLLATPNITDAQRANVQSLQARIDTHLETTSQLIMNVEVSLTDKALAAIEARKAYLAEQYALSQLAMVQLRDSDSNAPFVGENEENRSE